MPSDSTYEIGMLANADAYVSDTVDGTGHIRVTVSPTDVKVDYVKAYLPADTVSGVHHNREIGFTYSLTGTSVENEISAQNSVKIYPNPAKNQIKVDLADNSEPVKINIINTLGQTVMQTKSKTIDVSGIENGIYFISIKTNKYEINKKIIIAH